LDGFDHDGLHFEVRDRGPRRAPVVLLLHGFPGGADTWTEAAARLASGGFRCVSFDQRGYSPGARPAHVDAYRIDRLVGDARALLDHVGEEFVHVVGHDWGAIVAWHLAVADAGRVASLVAISTPHPGAFAEAWPRSTQAVRSLYALGFQLPVLPERMLLAGRGALMRAGLRASGLDAAWADRYTSAMLEPGRLTAALNWYRAAGRASISGYPAAPADVTVPTTFVWGTRDVSLSPTAARLNARRVTGPYRSVELDECTHWLPEMHVEQLWPHVEEHLARYAPKRRRREPSS
jgi:pimeloyl-ACP methyl ester carboxylesterase